MFKKGAAMLDDVVWVVGLVSGVMGVIGFFTAGGTVKHKFGYAAAFFLVALIGAIAYDQSNELKRKNDVARSATKLVVEHGSKFTHRGFVLASLAFLEFNRDLLPDAYARGVALCKNFKCNDPKSSVVMVDASFTFKDLIRGIGVMAESN